MALTIRLEDERGQMADQVFDVHGYLFLLMDLTDIKNTCCLRFIDEYGNTIFNNLQMEQLLAELASLYVYTTAPEQRKLLADVEYLARRCQGEHHFYIKLYGD